MRLDSRPISGAWRIVALLWVVAALNYLDRMMITTMRGSLVEAIPMTDAQFGLVTSIFLWVYGVLSPLAGFLADRFSRSRIIVVSLLLWSATTWLTGQAKTLDELLVARALMGASEACYIPAALALIADYHRGSTRSLATGIHISGVYVGAGLGGLGGWLAERHDWSFAFHLFGVAGIVYSALLALVLHDTTRDGGDAASTGAASRAKFVDALLSLFRSRSFVLMFVFWGLLSFAGWVISAWMPTYLNDRFHLAQGVAGLSATGYSQAAAIVGLLIGGIWADRWSQSNQRGRILVPIIGLCAAAPGVWLMANSDLLIVTLAGLALYGLARSFTDANMMPILCLVADPRYRATGYGVLNLAGCLVGGASIYVGGALRDAHVGLGRIFLCAACCIALCAVLLCFVRPTQRPVQQADRT